MTASPHDEEPGERADAAPELTVRAPDGVPIAVFRSGSATGHPIVLVHGATADHTTWRTSGPLLGAGHPLFAVDRRGRGASGDAAPDEPYAIEREFDDLAAVVEAVAADAGEPVDVVGHSYGGRVGLGAALRTNALRRLVCYEGAPPAADGPRYQDADARTVERLEALVTSGDRDEALATFMREIVGMPKPDLEAFRADPVWPRRAAAIGTTIRELRAEVEPAGSLSALGNVRQPVLQILGGASAPAFVAATQALDARLRDGRVVTIPGARHAAHHSHPIEFVAAIEAFLTAPARGTGADASPAASRAAAGYHRSMTNASASAAPTVPDPAAAPTDDRVYSPGLEGVLAGETALSRVDGANGRLTYRGYRIGDLVERGTYPAVAKLLWTGEWDSNARLATQPVPDAVLATLRALPSSAKPMDALRTAVSAWGATQALTWPPTVEQARALTAFSPSALAAFARLREGKDPIEPDPSLDLVEGFLYQLKGERPDPATARALDAYFIVGAEHGFNASTFTARVVIATQSDIASAVAAAIGTMKGPLHGGAPSEVVDQLAKMGSVDRAEQWLTEALDRHERLMGFGHRVYRAYDPRAAALRTVAEGMEHKPDWLELAIQVEDVALRLLAERHPDRALKTNVEYYAAPVLMGVGLSPDLFPATFSLARHAGWTAHVLEQAANNRLIRPDVRYIGPEERDLPD